MSEQVLNPEFIRAIVQAAITGLVVSVTEASHGANGPVYAVAFAAPEAEPTT